MGCGVASTNRLCGGLRYKSVLSYVPIHAGRLSRDCWRSAPLGEDCAGDCRELAERDEVQLPLFACRSSSSSASVGSVMVSP